MSWWQKHDNMHFSEFVGEIDSKYFYTWYAQYTKPRHRWWTRRLLLFFPCVFRHPVFYGVKHRFLFGLLCKEFRSRVYEVKARSRCTDRCREDTKRKKNLVVRRKTLYIRCVLIAYVLYTLYPSSIRTLGFHPLKKFWTAQKLLNGWTFRRLRCQSVTYTNNNPSMSVIIL